MNMIPTVQLLQSSDNSQSKTADLGKTKITKIVVTSMKGKWDCF